MNPSGWYMGVTTDGYHAATGEPWVAPEPRGKVFGLVCGAKFADTPRILEVLESAPKDATFVVRETDKIMRAACQVAGIEPVLAILNPYWKGETFDKRKTLRDWEIRFCCDRVMVFSDGSDSIKEWEAFKDVGKITVIHPKGYKCDSGATRAKRRSGKASRRADA